MSGSKEYNEVFQIGVKPSHGADPIPVEVAAWGADPLSVPPAAFVPGIDTHDWVYDVATLNSRTVLTVQYFYAPVNFPDGVTVSRLDLYGYRDDVDARLEVTLFRVDRVGGQAVMGTIEAVWTSGYSSGYDSSISLAVIDNANYGYVLRLRLNPNDVVGDVVFSGVKITFA